MANFSGKGAVYSFDPVGSYEREKYRAEGSSASMLQPFLDNQVSWFSFLIDCRDLAEMDESQSKVETEEAKFHPSINRIPWKAISQPTLSQTCTLHQFTPS